MKYTLISALSLVFFASVNFSCQRGDKASTPSSSTAGSKEVNLSIWSNFVTDKMLEDFTAKTGIKVNVSNYSSNEELLAKLKAGASGIDVAVPADYIVYAMSQMELLEKLDLSKISAHADLNPKLLKQEFDPENNYSVPFDWGTTGLAVNRSLTKEAVTGWNDVINSKTLAGKFTLLDDVRETLGLALKINGYSLNSTQKAEIEKAGKTLQQIRSKVKAYTSETLQGLVSGEMAVAHAYSSDALQARVKTKGQIDYMIPVEGCTLWIDTLVIPKGARNIEGAYALINFLLDPAVGAERTQNIMVAPSNIKAVAILPPELKNNAGLFPSEAQLAKCESIKDVGESLVAWDQAWTTLKASSD